MATRYRLKRESEGLKAQRQFSVLDAAGNVLGGAVKTTGDIIGSGVGKAAGAYGGWKLANAAMNTMKAGGVAGKLGMTAAAAHPILGLAAGVGGAILGAKAMKGIGKSLHNAGNSLQM